MCFWLTFLCRRTVLKVLQWSDIVAIATSRNTSTAVTENSSELKTSHIIVCHGETVAEIFPQWLRLSYRRGQHYQAYDLNMPPSIPKRPLEQFRYDPPLTEHGNLTAEFVGHAIKLAKYDPHVIYSSPELRCVQTACAIARAFTTKAIMVCVEPALADWVQLTPQGTSKHWLTPHKYALLGYPINLDYKPYLIELPAVESPTDYLRRLGHFFFTLSGPNENIATMHLFIQNCVIVCRLSVVVTNAHAIEAARRGPWSNAQQICEIKNSIRNGDVCEIMIAPDKRVSIHLISLLIEFRYFIVCFCSNP
ncbi:phosphoglycerate mutase family protein [Dictyocaulus viviparus]|uniref:Phosphoglycerate mutase family protein n=1 Tax=Dictyocaulus viviparus TaxID=29172 RepID=A0A0D8XX42_DICVI|nr:phosphoglycerate mutase family protein [Dictyocaulus viviparus]